MRDSYGAPLCGGTISKPPLGLMPKDKWDLQRNQERRNAILAAMKRYAEAGYATPVAWFEELEAML